MVDLVAVSSAFATIVGLVCNYAAERRVGVSDPFADFMDYLRVSHDEIRRKIDENRDLNQALRRLLSQENDVVLHKLERLDQILAGVAANLDDFRQLSVAVYKEEVLSEEAVGILTKFYDSGDARFLEVKNPGGALYLPLETGAEGMTFEHRFLEDDLRTLCELGFLTLSHSSQGGRIFILTRQAARCVEAIRAQAPGG
jgi:hypothetical protein